MTAFSTPVGQPTGTPRPGRGVRAVAAVTVTCCVGFALVNLDLMTTGVFAGVGYDRRSAEYPVGFAVMNVLVLVVKLVGAVVAALTVAAPRRRFRPAVVGVCAWTAFTLAVYTLGNVLHSAVMVPGSIGLRSVAYLGFCVVFATGYGILAVSYQRRAGLRARHVVVGALGAPVVLGANAVAIGVLTALDLLPAAG